MVFFSLLSSRCWFSLSFLRWKTIQLSSIIMIALLLNNNNPRCNIVIVDASSSSSYYSNPSMKTRLHNNMHTYNHAFHDTPCNDDNVDYEPYKDGSNSQPTEFYAYKSFWNLSFASSRKKRDKTSTAATTSNYSNRNDKIIRDSAPTNDEWEDPIDGTHQPKQDYTNHHNSVRTVSMQRNHLKKDKTASTHVVDDHRNLDEHCPNHNPYSEYYDSTPTIHPKDHNNDNNNPLSLLLDCTIGLVQDDPDDFTDDDEDFYTEDGEYHPYDEDGKDYPPDNQQQHYSSGKNHNHVKISTLVDTGAQATFLSVEAARRVGILHLMDTRYAGYAKGVGGIPTQVLGRIPANTVLLTLGNGLFQVSPSILILSSSSLEESSSSHSVTSTVNSALSEDNTNDTIDLLLGMDLLMEWKAKICLQTMQLILVPPTSKFRYDTTTQENTVIKLPFLNTSPQSSNDHQHHHYPNSKRTTKPAFLLLSTPPPVLQDEQQEDDEGLLLLEEQKHGDVTISSCPASKTNSDLESDLNWLDHHNNMVEPSSSFFERHFESTKNSYSYYRETNEREKGKTESPSSQTKSIQASSIQSSTTDTSSSSSTEETVPSAIAISTEDDEDENDESDDWNDDDHDLMYDLSGI